MPQTIWDWIGLACYISLALVALFGAFCCVSVWSRIGQKWFRSEDEQDAFLDSIDADLMAGVTDAIKPKDRHVIGAALAGEATIVVTNDKRLRAETGAADIGLLAMSADDFAAHLWELMPDDVGEVVHALVEKRTKRPVTTEELVETLRGPFPAMVAAWFSVRRG